METTKRTLLLMTLAALALVWLQPAHSEAAEAVWVQHYDGPGNDLDVATAVALDTNGNLFVTGYSTGSGGGYDYTTIKYSGSGVPLWTNRYDGGNGGNQAQAVAVDANGNVFVTGNSGDFATIKYSNAGMPLWTNRYNGPGNNADGAGAIALDTSGNVFVTGYSLGVKIGNVDPTFDFATVKYSGAGVPLWTNRYDGPGHGDDYPFALAVDGSGNVIVTGRARGGNFWPDYATIKYSAAGVPLWTNRFNGGGDALDEARAVAVDTNGNVFVTGQTWGAGNVDYATIKYSGAGVPGWTNYYNGLPSGDDYATAMGVDSSGNVVVTGFSHGSGTIYDYVTIKYSGAGVPVWTNRTDGPGNDNDQATAMALDSSGNVYVTGYSFISGPGWGYGTVAYSGAGVPLWMNWHSGPGVSIGLAKGSVAADGRGNVFVTGYSPGIDSGYDYLIIRYSVLPSLTIARTKTNTVAVSWPSPSTGFTLQQNTNGVATVNWSNVLNLPTDNGTTKTFIVNPPSGASFFRLKSE